MCLICFVSSIVACSYSPSLKSCVSSANCEKLLFCALSAEDEMPASKTALFNLPENDALKCTR